MKKRIAYLLAFLLAAGMLPLGVLAAQPRITGVNIASSKVPVLQEPVVYLGSPVRFQVPNEAFLWDGPLEEDTVITSEMIAALPILTLHVKGDAPVLACVGEPGWEVVGGKLFILLETRQLGEELSLSVAIGNNNRPARYGAGIVSIREYVEPGDGGGDGNGDGGDGEDGEDGNGDGGGDDGGGDGDGHGGNGDGSGDGDGGSGDGDGHSGGGDNGVSPGDGDGDGGGTTPPQTGGTLSISGLSGDLQRVVREALGDSVEVEAGDQLWFPLPAALFSWKDENGAAAQAPEEPVTLAQLEQAGVTLGVSGDPVVTASFLEARGGRAGAGLQIAGKILSLDDVAFSCTMVLRCGERSATAQVQGTVRVQVERPGPGTETLDLSDGVVVEPEADLDDVQLLLGAGVILRADLRAGSRYGGVAQVAQAGNSPLEGVREVRELYLLGLDTAASAALLESAEAGHLYDANGDYLGATGQWIPLRSLYYLCDSAPVDGTAPPSRSGSSGGGVLPGSNQTPAGFYSNEAGTSSGKVAPEDDGANWTDNPNTGR